MLINVVSAGNSQVTEQGSVMEELAAAFSDTDRAPAWGPIVVNRPARAEQRLLKVVAFNAHGGGSLDAISATLRRRPLDYPDIILLSEMDWRMRRSGRRETAAELATDLGMSFAYIGEFGVLPPKGEPVAFVGNAILSSRPLADVRVLRMARNSNRQHLRRWVGTSAGLAAKVMVNRRPLVLGIAHLHSRWNPSGRELQMRRYLEGFPAGVAAIIGGDFNTTTVDLSSRAALIKAMVLSLLQRHRFRNPQKWEPLFERLREAGFKIAGANVNGKATFTPNRFIPPVVRPKLDWLALRGHKPVAGSAMVVPARTSLLAPRFSDHDFIMCTVEA
jgi:endonuclease/exonuclease/phosphatase family metal-dependent hydrolase